MFEIGVTYHFAKGKIREETDKFFDKENESNIVADDNDESYQKLGPEKEKLKKKLINDKKESVSSFQKIEDKHNENLLSHSNYLKKIYEFKNNSGRKGDFFDNQILEKNLFDKDMADSDNNDKNNQDFSGNRQRFDRIEYLLNLEKEKREKEGTLDPAKLKHDIINIFKEEKMNVTDILQKSLSELYKQLEQEVSEFRNKEISNNKELEEHNDKINNIQRKINIIYQRSHRHITNIMEELNVLMMNLDNLDKLNSY